jgi:hypothetical protein
MDSDDADLSLERKRKGTWDELFYGYGFGEIAGLVDV